LILARRTLLTLQSLRPPQLWDWSLLVETLVIVCVMIAVIVADEAVARGVPRLRAYLCAIVLGCATAAWAQWELRVLLDWGVVATPDDDGWFALMLPQK